MSKNNTLALAVGSPLLVIALAAAYYFVLFLPQNAQAVALAKSQADCSQMQEAQLEPWKKSGASASDILSATNHYNPTLKKCFVEINDTTLSSGISVTGVRYSDSYVSATLMDAVENVTIANCDIDHSMGGKQSVITCTDSKGNDISTEQFYTIEKQYMERDEPTL